ncbi:hypothetical protein IMZ16_04145 [Cruoricaptor ignavus]|uniref:Helix-turn-helix domain-containing protein n=1 Tax=Cruoricaptor ignavus TaxID=1118202 RepID=A0A7M1T6X9_9FLAO|nr:helix-turn-helix domain-containing protein [Cruoricaptor ignavus]QOR74632.1 hypothetical protein IMZ16_04145 [Cruoricaptor ignavus]
MILEEAWKVMATTKITSTSQLLLIYLLCFEDEIVQISEIKLSERLGCSKRTIASAKQELIRKGLLEFKRKGFGNIGTYKLIIPPADKVEQEIHEKVTESSVPSSDIPTLHEFVNYAKTLPIYDSSLDFFVTSKYQSWIDNGWKLLIGNGKTPIRNWKGSLRTAMDAYKNKGNFKSVLPTIQRPLSTYNEEYR